MQAISVIVSSLSCSDLQCVIKSYSSWSCHDLCVSDGLCYSTFMG